MKTKKFYTMDEIRNMSEEEVNALNRKAVRNIALFFGIKWGLIIGISYLGKKVYQKHAPQYIQVKEQ